MADDVTVVIPVYNEAAVIADVVHETLGAIATHLPGTELVVVDDGSTDATAAILATLEGGPVRVLRQERNGGQGPALRRGFDAGRTAWVCQIDGDGQIVPADFWALWERRAGADLLLGVRRPRQDPGHRRALTRAVRVITAAACRRRLEDAASPLRLMRRETWLDVRGELAEDAVAVPILVAVAACRRGWRVEEVLVGHRARPAGTSHLRGLRLVRYMAAAAVEVTALTVRVRRRPRRPPPVGA